MNNKPILFLGTLLLMTLLFATFVLADSHLPPAIQKIIDYNKQHTLDFSVKISFFIAFVAGMLGILSPCILPFIPAYFSYTFKEKKNITKMTFVFFLGFSLVFVTMGIVAGFLGEQTLVVLQKSWLVILAGLLLIAMGVLSLLGLGFSSFIKIRHKGKNDVPGTFLFGIAYAAGWSACLGPILAGILGIGAILGNIWYSALLLFFYSLGNLVPLFIISIFYDKFNLSQSKLIQGKLITYSLFGKKFYADTTKIIAGILFIVLGIVIIVFKGTAIVNAWDIFGTKEYFYSEQNALISSPYALWISIAFFFLFIGLLAWFYFSQKKKVKHNES